MYKYTDIYTYTHTYIYIYIYTRIPVAMLPDSSRVGWVGRRPV